MLEVDGDEIIPEPGPGERGRHDVRERRHIAVGISRRTCVGHRLVEDRHQQRDVVIDVADHERPAQDERIVTGRHDDGRDAAPSASASRTSSSAGRSRPDDLGPRAVQRLRRLVGDVAVADQQDVCQTAQSSPTRAVPNMSVRRSMS